MTMSVVVHVVGRLDVSDIGELSLRRPDGGSTAGWEIQQEQRQPVIHVNGSAVKTTLVSSDVEGENGIVVLSVDLPLEAQ